MRTAKFQYKCRQCGKIEENPCCGEKFALITLIEVQITNKHSTFPGSGIRVTKESIHNCSKTEVGISDLIGYKTYEDA